MNYKMILQYDGTRYSGWQRQKATDNTIQGKLEAILTKMAGEPVEVHGAGRTDAGVHARGQVAHFSLNTDMTAEEIKEAAESLGLAIGNIVESPMEGLIRYHSNNQ